MANFTIQKYLVCEFSHIVFCESIEMLYKVGGQINRDTILIVTMLQYAFISSYGYVFIST